MQTIECETTAEVQTALGAASPDALFRGQVREYHRADGGPDLRTSIDRHGCVPNRMLKWWHYSRAILATYIADFDGETDLATDQAILQHYGWRSFFLDASADPLVAAWFAGNAYRTERQVELIEDCWEDPLWAIRERGRYEPANGRGCIYVLSRKALRKHGLQAVDLVEVTTPEGRHRCETQAAFMIGPVQGNLPDDCIRSRIFAPTEAFAALAAERPNLTQEYLFPGPQADPFLATLLSIPWVKREAEVDPEIGIDFFDRGLLLPEYDWKPLRRPGPRTAFYSRYWLADVANSEPHLSDMTFYLTVETLFHGSATGDLHFPQLTKLAQQQRRVAVEIDGLVHHPSSRPGNYGKGIYLEAQEDGSILLSELLVEHFGTRPAGWGVSRGIYYQPDFGGTWSAVQHAEQCDCGKIAHHAHHLTVAEHFEHALAEGMFKQVREHVFASYDVNPQSDPTVLQWLNQEDE